MRGVSLMLTLALIGSSPRDRQPVFRTGIELVRLDVSVTRHGQPVLGLNSDAFIVTDNGVPQHVASVTLERVPLSVLLVLDTSGSMAGDKLERLVDAARAVVASLRPPDRAAVVSFSHAINVRARLTTERPPVETALALLEADGATALRDALFSALQLRPDDDSRPLVLLFSDGADNGSWLTETETLESVRRAGVTVHSIEIHEPPSFPTTNARGMMIRPPATRPGFLERVADVSGGRRWLGGSSRELRELFARALEEMRGRYVLSFYPQGVTSQGWHELSVKLRTAAGDVRTRPGYFVANPSQ